MTNCISYPATMRDALRNHDTDQRFQINALLRHEGQAAHAAFHNQCIHFTWHHAFLCWQMQGNQLLLLLWAHEQVRSAQIRFSCSPTEAAIQDHNSRTTSSAYSKSHGHPPDIQAACLLPGHSKSDGHEAHSRETQ